MRKLRKMRDLAGYQLHARDGEIGKLKQIYFDDQYWTVRYFIVHTGSWLFGQDVLIAPSTITLVDEENKCLEVDLSREQIKNCPPVDTELPVSRHYEQAYYSYYGWAPYWSGDPLLGPPPIMPPPAMGEEPKEPEHPHLRSSDEVSSYRIHARDGEIGHVEDFILEDPGWAVRYLEIDTRNWLPSKNVLISPAWTQSIDWAKQEVTVNLACQALQTAPAYDASEVINREYELTLYNHYGMKYDEE